MQSKLISSRLTKWAIYSSLSLVFLLTPSSVLAAKFSLLPSDTSSEVGDHIDIDIHLDTEGQPTTGATATIKFDSDRYAISNLKGGTTYSNYPAAIVETSPGRIHITGHVNSSTNRFNGSGIFASFTVTLLKTGTSSLSFDFTPGNRNDSNVTSIEPGNALDILTSVSNISLTATEDSDGQPNPTTIPTHTPPPPTPTGTKTIYNLYRNLTNSNNQNPTPTFSPDEPLPILTPISELEDRTHRPIATIIDEPEESSNLIDLLTSPYIIAVIFGLILLIIILIIIKKKSDSLKQTE